VRAELFMSSIVVLRGVSFELPNGRTLFSDVDLTLEDELSALVGVNGVGKTVLASIVAGEIPPTSGQVQRTSTIVRLPQREQPPPISVGEYLAADYVWSRLGERLLSGVDCKLSCTSLSGGQWMRVRLARVLCGDFSILDEPTNDLDRDGREAVRDYLRSKRGGALLISHDRECLALCDVVLELSNQGIAKHSGGWAKYLQSKSGERERAEARLTLAKRERDRVLADSAAKQAAQERRNRRGAETAGHGGAPRLLLGARKRRAQQTSGKLHIAANERAQAALGAARTALTQMKLEPVIDADITGASVPAQKLIAQASGFNILLGEWLYETDLNFTWRGNTRVALRGPNGSGKSTLLKALLGAKFQTRGMLSRGSLSTLYIDQLCGFLDDGKSILDQVRDHTAENADRTRDALARFLFTGDDVFQKVGELSGGERLRVALACGFLQSGTRELLLLDEPTNNLDLPNIEFLERIIREFRGAVVIVSHDDTFLQGCEIWEELLLSSAIAPGTQ
jgi:ATPase subunit of ABC transporter with duplicated ATPase domains